MDLTPYVTGVEDNLLAAAAAGDEGTRRTAAALAAALDPAVRLALMNALAEAAADVTDTLGDRVVELRLEGGDVRVVVTSPEAGEEPAPHAHAASLDAGGEQTRITLRLPEGLKAQAEQAAAAETLSLNTWLTRAVHEALARESRPPARAREGRGQRVRGWVQG
jgi:predicted HicB family RNase H-like nuclease